MNKEFEKQALISIKVIREWEELEFMQKWARKRQRPSQIDYRLANVWIRYHDVNVALGEKEKELNGDKHETN